MMNGPHRSETNPEAAVDQPDRGLPVPEFVVFRLLQLIRDASPEF